MLNYFSTKVWHETKIEKFQRISLGESETEGWPMAQMQGRRLNHQRNDDIKKALSAVKKWSFYYENEAKNYARTNPF
jgi:hypothetical protein